MSFYVSTATFFLLHCDEWDRVVALPRHKFVTGASLLQLSFYGNAMKKKVVTRMSLRSDKDVETYLLKSRSDDNERMSCYRQFIRGFNFYKENYIHYLHQRFTQCSKWSTSYILFRSCCNILHPSIMYVKR